MTEIEQGSVDAAIAEIQGALKRAKTPSRYSVRDVLMGIGTWLEAGDEAKAGPALEAARALFGDPHGARVAIEEITLAVTEHVRSTDPRYLTLPRYDLHYTLEARERLEARLVCAERIGLAVPEHLLEAVAAADERLKPLLERGTKA